MKPFRFLLTCLSLAVAVVLYAAPPPAQADEPAPNLVLTTLYFQYEMDDGSSGSGSYLLADTAAFMDNDGNRGVWGFDPISDMYLIYYNTGAHCGAISIALQNFTNNQVQGIRLCTDGSGARGVWAGVLWFNGVTTRISVASDGTEGNLGSSASDISADERYIGFGSEANNLVEGDANESSDGFIYDRQTGQITRVTVASDGTEGNDDSGGPKLSADGQYAVFSSLARNLVSDDTNWRQDIFVHDRQTGQTSRVSVSSDGAQANDYSFDFDVSADGQYIVFESPATNLVANDTNEAWDIFLHDQQTGQTSRISVAADGTEGNDNSYDPAISADGRYVSFRSWASNFVSGDTNGYSDIFVHDRLTGEISRVSVASDGTQADSTSFHSDLSADGRYVAFQCFATNLVADDTNEVGDIFVHDRVMGETRRVSVASDSTQGNGESSAPSISADGRYVAFDSEANNLVSNDINWRMDVFVYDRQTEQTVRVSVASNGVQGNRRSYTPKISTDGQYVLFSSDAFNLVEGDTNLENDVFVRDRGQ